MPCPETAERLPELLNGTLPADARAEVLAHLRDCADCRAEWEETRAGAAILGSHLSADTIVALAWDRPDVGMDAELARRHLAQCPDCADDLAATRESRSRESAAEAAPTPARRDTLWLGLAATLAAFAVGSWLGGWSARDAARRSEALRLEAVASAQRLEAEAGRLRDASSALSARLARLAAPIPNLPLIELLPGSATRGATEARPELVIGPGDLQAALVLSGPTGRGLLSAELRGADGRVLWTATGLRPATVGGYVLGVPADLLPDGDASIVLVEDPHKPPLATLPFRVRRTR